MSHSNGTGGKGESLVERLWNRITGLVENEHLVDDVERREREMRIRRQLIKREAESWLQGS